MRSQSLPWTALSITKIILTIYLLINALATLIINLYYHGSNANASFVDLLYPIVTVLTILGVLCCILMARRNGMVTSGILHITLILFLFCGFPEYFFKWQEIGNFRWIFFSQCQMWIRLTFSFIIYGTQLLLFKQSIPELDSSFLNRLSFWWFSTIPLLGARKTLVIDDLYDLNEGNTAAYLSAKWEKLLSQKTKIYERTLHNDSAPKSSKKKNRPKPPSIVWRLFLMFRFEILSASAVKILSDIMQFANPFFLNLLLNYISTGDHTSMEGLVYVMAIFTCAELRSFLLNYYFHLMMRVSAKIQTTLTIAIYQKTLRLSNSARKTKTVGEIVNLMAVDVESFQFVTPHIQQLWSCPFQIAIILIYLFFTIGISAACGVSVMILFLPLNALTSIITKNGRFTEQMRLKDERMKICNEILNGIKVIKLYAWEPPMEEAVERIRRKELYLIRKDFSASFLISSRLIVPQFGISEDDSFLQSGNADLCNIHAVKSNNILTPQIAFVSLTLFNQLRTNGSIRISDEAGNRNTENAVEIREARLNWNAGESEAILKIDYFMVPKKSLVAVVGRVGTGKSSLLAAILGEMEKAEGYIGVSGQMAVVNQQPWIQNSSLRDNIIFGKQFDRKYYDKIIEACALIKDLEILPDGDDTEIGEKKTRVALARAVYQNRDIYLLDDPLSAVDSHVGKHIFEEVIGHNGLLRNKTRILVTNNLAYLNEVDVVAYMQDGKLTAYGPYKRLLEQSENFSKFIEACQIENEKCQDSKRESEISGSGNMKNLILEISTKETSLRLSRRISALSTLDRKSSRISHRSSLVKSFSEYSNSPMSNDVKKEKTKIIKVEEVEVGRMGRGLWLSKWLHNIKNFSVEYS
ncbi:ABC transporter transmembrane region family protein [Dirofilaria immitis]|nr:ABC transporter transmembrane region family protein [Dirofilaria immitis]